MPMSINIVLGANTVNFSRNIQKATKKAEQELGGLAGLAQKAFDKINAGTLIGAGTLTTIVAAADKMQSLASKVKLATDSAEQFTAVQNQLRAVANEQRSSFEGVVDLYSSSQRALFQLGKSQQDVINFTRNMTMAMNLGGGSAQAQAAALTQLGQALGSGALRGDEFNSVAEQAPILMELIAKRMGVATAALRDLAKEGKITADVVYEAVSGSTQALEEMMSKTNFTMSQGWQVVKDNFGYLVHDIINETTGIAGAVSDVLAFVGQNLKTIATIAGVAAAVIGVKMAQGWLVAKLGVDSLTGSLTTKMAALRTTTVATVQSAYSMQNYAMVAGRVGLALDYAKLSAAAFGIAVLGGGVIAVEKASLALTQAGATLTAYRTQLQATWATTQAYIAQNFTLANAKAAVTASFATATTAVTGYITAKRTAIGNTITYIRSQSLLTHGKNLLTGSVRLATGGITGFIGAVRAGTVSVAGYTRAIVTSTIAKRAFVGTATLASSAVAKVGGAFASVGRIILAHPIMTIAAVISAVIVRTMGLQKAMESLSDAVGIVGSMLGDLIDVGINGFKWLGGVADRFFSGFMSEGKQSTGFVGKYFGWLFEGTEGGFVGLLQVIARVADKFVGFFYAATRAIYRNMVSLWNSLKQGFADAFNSVSKTVETSINAVLDTYDKVIGKVNGLIRDAKAAASVVGLDGLVPNERATIGYRVKAITLNPTPTENIGGSLTQDWQGFNHVSNYADGKIANQKALKNQDSLANSVDGLAKSLDKAKGVNDAAAKAGKSLTDAHKNQQQQVDKTSEAYKKLLEAYNSKMLDWQKAMWENQHVKAGLEVEKIEWEFTEDGGFAKASNAIKNNLRLQALELDRSNAIKEIQAKTREIERSHLEFGTAYEEIMAGIHDETNKLSALLRDVGVEAANLDDITEIVKNAQSSLQADGSVDLGQTQLIIHRWQALQKFKADSISELKKLATAEVNAAELATHKTLDELDLQLESLGSQSELARQLLTIDNERSASIKKYSRMIDHIKSVDGELAKSLKDRVTANADLIAEKNKQLVVTQAYQNIVSELKTDEQKRLDTLKEQLDVLTAHSKAMSVSLDIERAKQLIGQNVRLATSINHYDELNAKTQGQYDSLDTGLQALLNNERLTEEERINIKQWGADERLKIEKAHSDAMRSLILSDSENIFGSLASIAKDGLGEQSRVYRAMFAMQQGFAIAQAGIAMSQAMSQGLAKGFPLGLADMALAVSHGAKIVSAIKSVVMPVGQAHDGIMSVPKSGTWNLEKGERVLPKHTAQNLDNTLNRLQGNGGGQIVNVNVTVNANNGDVESSHNLGKNLGNAIKLAVQAELQKERRQGGLLYGR